MSSIHIQLRPTGSAINFPQHDAGEGFDRIESGLVALGFKKRRNWSTVFEEATLYRIGSFEALVSWDGYFTDLTRVGGGGLLELFEAMSASPHFHAIEVAPEAS